MKFFSGKTPLEMAEGNGEVSLEEVPEQECDAIRTEDYDKLIQYGLDDKVAAKLDDIYKSGKLAHAELDARALDALREFPAGGALAVLAQFLDSNLEHVSNKSAFLCGVMKTYRQKSRAGAQGTPTAAPVVPVKGPDEDKIKEILERTGYTLDVTTGQRKYGGPPPGWSGPAPGAGCEVFCGKIPKELFEDELIPLFERCGRIWDLRLMMDPMTGANRGYAFVTFAGRDAARNAVTELNDYDIRKGKKIGVTISFNNHRLFVGNIPKNRDRDDLFEEFTRHAPGLMEVIIYSSPDDKKKNRGFCFLEYESHKAASLAKRRLGTGRIKVWGCDIIVDWADPQEEPDEQTMSKVKVLYVRNLTQDTSEDTLKEVFENYGKVERVKKIKDYAFVHFEDRDNAVKAMRDLDGKEMGGALIEVSLAKPPSDKKKKEEILRARERRMMQMIHGRGGCSPSHPSMMGMVRSNMAPPLGRGDYDYDYDYYGYGDYRGGYNEPYYRNDEFYFDYAAPRALAAHNRSQPEEEPEHGSSYLYHDMAGGIQVGRGRGAAAAARGARAGAGTAGAGAGAGVGAGAAATGAGAAGAAPRRRAPAAPPRGRPPLATATHRHLRGNLRARASLPGKRKYDGGHQNQGGERKRRLGEGEEEAEGEGESQWGGAPLAQQPLRSGASNGEAEGACAADDAFSRWP